jgi:TonB family protein
MSRDTRFWRNVALIAIAHLAILLALARGSRDTQSANVPNIVWMNSAAIPAIAPAPPVAEIAVPPPQPEKKEEPAVPALARSEIEIPSPTPIAAPTATPTAKPTPAPVPKATPKPSPKPTAKPTPKESPKKAVVEKATPQASPKKESASEKKEKSDDDKKAALAKKEPATSSNQSADKSSLAGDGPGNGSGRTSEFAWYRSMLHDRFHKEWEQPRTVLATGAKMSTLVKIRIEKDGRVSKFTIVKPSGNIVVDESVAAIAQRVTHVDPLPNGLIKGPDYEVQINFELNPEK